VLVRCLIVTLCLAAVAVGTTSPTQAGDKTGSKVLHPFVLSDMNGKDFNVAKHLGKDVIVLAFWATWCKPCKIELAALHEIYLKRKDKGLLVIAVSTDGPDSRSEVTGFIRTHSYQFPVILDQETSLLERYNPRGDIPFSIVVNRNGVIVETHQGYNPGDEIPLLKKLDKLLAEKPAAGQASKGGSVGINWFPTEPAHVEGTLSFRMRYLHDNANGRSTDDKVFALINRLSIGAATGPFRMGIRSDNTIFPGYNREERCKGKSLSECQWEGDHRIERFWLQYRTRQLELRAGDFYQSMGSGLVFSVRKIDELGLDTSLRGGLARGRIGPVTITGLGGKTNIQNIELLEVGRIDDPDDVIAGGEVTLALPHNMTVGVRGLYVDYKEAPGGVKDEGDWVAGGSFAIRNIADMLSIVVEGAFIRNLTTSNLTGQNRDADGYAVYSNVVITPAEGFSLLLEFKDYHRFQLQNPSSALPIVYHEPPTLERFDQIVPTAFNATGGRLKVEYYIKPIGLLVFANGIYYGFSDSSDQTFDEPVDNFGDKASSVLHAYAGVEKRWKSGHYINISGGWRNEGVNKPAEGAPGFTRRLWHVESDIQIPLSGKHAVGLRTNHRTEEKLDGKSDTKKFVRGDVALTYSFAPNLSVGLVWTYQTENPEKDDNGNPIPGGQEEFGNVFGEVVYRISDWGQISLGGGRMTGGIICVSGVCRTLPPFFGVRSEFVARF
jgi:peroxiredoxin